MDSSTVINKPDSKASLKSWFITEIYYSRCFNSIFWLLIVLPIFNILILCALKFDLSHPIQWLLFFRMAPLIESAAILGLLSFFTVIIIIIQIRCVKVIPDVITKRIGLLWTLLNPFHLCAIFTYTVIGGFIVRNYLKFLADDSSNLTYTCGLNSEVCLNEVHLFVILHGLLTAALFGCDYFLNNKNLISFPVTQQLKYTQFKEALSKMFLSSVKTILHRLKWFYIFYLLFGSIPKSWIVTYLSLKISPNAVAVNSMYGLLNFRLFWLTWLTSVAIHFLWHLSLSILQICHTEHFRFGVKVTTDSNLIYLNQALATDDVPMLQHLGYLDLRLLAEFDPFRRQEIFSLSHPGGHSHYWTSLVVECLSSLVEFTGTLNSINNIVPKTKVQDPECEKLPIVPTIAPMIILKSRFICLFRKVVTFVKQQPIISYFLSEFPDANYRKAFAESQTHIWTIEALSFLVVASLNEDKYGVVQNSFADIVTVLLNLQQTLEKQQKLITSRPTKLSQSRKDIHFRRSLSSTLQTSLYRIACAFSNHIRGTDLLPEDKQRLQQYSTFK